MAEEARTMFAGDAISSSLARAFITVRGNRYLLFQGKKLDATYTKDKKQLGILGRTTKGNRAVGGKGAGKLTIYKNTDLFTRMIVEYQNTGKDTYFDMQIENEDPTSNAGSRTVILKDCNIDSASIAAFDVDGDWLEEEIDFTFEKVLLVKEFDMLDGMMA